MALFWSPMPVDDCAISEVLLYVYLVHRRSPNACIIPLREHYMSFLLLLLRLAITD